MHRIAVVVVPPASSFELATPGLVFGSARVAGRPAYEVVLCAPEPGVTTTIEGMAVTVTRGLDAVDDADTVFVNGGVTTRHVDPRVLAALRRAAGAGSRVGTLSCGGALHLAEAGLLDGRAATVHWGLSDDFRGRFPGVRLRPDVLYVEDGPILTTSGHAGAVDLCLHLIRTDHGGAVAGDVARGLAAGPMRPGDHAQAVRAPVPPAAESLADTRAWAMARLDQALGVRDLAEHANVSVRTLTRRFQAETGLSPLRWLLHQRVERALELLAATDLTVDLVARRSGMGTADSLRRSLVRRVGLTPRAYRSAVREGAAPPAVGARAA